MSTIRAVKLIRVKTGEFRLILVINEDGKRKVLVDSTGSNESPSKALARIGEALSQEPSA